MPSSDRITRKSVKDSSKTLISERAKRSSLRNITSSASRQEIMNLEDANFKRGLAQKRQIKAENKRIAHTSAKSLSEREKRAMLRDKNRQSSKPSTPISSKRPKTNSSAQETKKVTSDSKTELLNTESINPEPVTHQLTLF